MSLVACSLLLGFRGLAPAPSDADGTGAGPASAPVPSPCGDASDGLIGRLGWHRDLVIPRHLLNWIKGRLCLRELVLPKARLLFGRSSRQHGFLAVPHFNK